MKKLALLALFIPLAALGQVNNGDPFAMHTSGGTFNGKVTLSDKALAISQNYAPVSIVSFGAVCNASALVTDGVLTSATAFSSASQTFTSADIGKSIVILGAGANQTSFTTTIQSVGGAHNVVLAASASISSGTALSFRYGSDDTTPINNAILSGNPLINPPNAACLVAGALSMPKGVKQLNWQFNNSTLVFTGNGGGTCDRQVNGLIQLHPSEGSPINLQGPGTLQAMNSATSCIANFSQTLANSGDGFSHNFRSEGMTYVGIADTPSLRGTNSLTSIWTFFSGEVKLRDNFFQTFGASDIIATGTSNQSDIFTVDTNDFQGTYLHAPHVKVQNPQGLSIKNNNMETSMVSIVSSGSANVSIRDNWYGDGCAGVLTTSISSVARNASGVVTIVYTTPHHLSAGMQSTYTGLTVDPTMNGAQTITAVPNTMTVQFSQAGSVIATTPDTAGSSFAATDILAAINLSGGNGDVDSNFIFSQNCHGLSTGIALSGAAAFNVTGNAVSSFGTGISTAGTSSNSIFHNLISNTVTNIDIESSANVIAGNTFGNGTTGINIGAGTGNSILTNLNFATSFINCAGGSNNSILNNSGTFTSCQGQNDVNVPGVMHALGGTLGWGPAGSVQIPSSNSLYSAGRLNNPFTFFANGSFTPSLTAQNGEIHGYSSGAPSQGCIPFSAGGGDGSGTGTASSEYFMLLCGAGSGAGTGLVVYQGATKIMQMDSTGLHVFSGTIVPTLSGTTGSIGGSALTAGQCASGTASIASTTTSMVASTSPATDTGTGFTWNAFVSAPGTVTVRVCAALAGTPTSSVYNVRVQQ